MNLLRAAFFISLLISITSKAGTLSLPLNKNQQGRPAEDLVYKDGQIDSDEALELYRKGKDLSKLDITPSVFWVGKKLKPTTDTSYPKEGSLFKFHSYPRAPTEIFRASLDFETTEGKKRFSLNLSLDNHAAIIRAGLLRLMGYDVEIPKYFNELKVSFKNEKEKDEFKLRLSEQTLTASKRWIIDETDSELTIKSAVLEPASIKTINAAWGTMTELRQASRRSFRALFVPYILTNYVENVNLISWELGQVFDKSLVLNYPYAEEFTDVTLADFHWALRKLTSLSRTEWESVFASSGYPSGVKELILEKTLSRLLSLVRKSQFNEDVSIPYNDQLLLENVVDGKLIKAVGSEKYALNFYAEDPESPFRIGELYRFFKIRVLYGGLSLALDEIQRQIPFSRRDAFKDIQERIEKGDAPSIKPLGVWTAPYATGRIRASRNVVFGQFRGSDAPIQLVDSAGLELGGGLVGRWKPFWKKVAPGLGIGASVLRTFTHIKAMPDIQAVNKYKFKNLYIPSLLKRTGRVISKFQCSVLETPHVVETEIDGELFYTIRYDKELTDGKEQALKLREKIISQGIPADKILLSAVDRLALCETEEKEFLNGIITKFLEQFSKDETFTITDELRLNGEVNVNIPFQVGVTADVGFSLRRNRKFLRSYIIRKKDDGFEIVWNRIKTRNNNFQLQGKYFIRLISGEIGGEKNKLKSDIYFINLKEGSIVEKRTALMVIRSLFTNRNNELLEEHYKPIKADHEAKTTYTKFKLLFWGKEHFRMKHDLSLKLTDQDNKQHTRTFHTNIIAKRTGSDNLGFISEVLGDLTSGMVSGLLASETQDPGQSLWGRSTRFVVHNEVETTPEKEPLMMTRVQWGYKGSGAKPRRLERIFEKLEAVVGRNSKAPLIDRGHFKQMSKLKSYDAQANLLLYPSAHTTLLIGLSDLPRKTRLNFFKTLYGRKKSERACSAENQGKNILIDEQEICAPYDVVDVYEEFEEIYAPLNRREKAHRISKVFYKLFKKFDTVQLLEIIGAKNWFYNIRVSGFRSENSSGYVNYISDTVGKYDNRLGTGILDYIGSELKISSYELKGMRFTPGLQ